MDAMLNRMRADQHDRSSADFPPSADRQGAQTASTNHGGLPLMAHALALVLAVSLASLSVGATLA